MAKLGRMSEPARIRRPACKKLLLFERRIAACQVIIKAKLNRIDGKIVTEPFPIVLDVADSGIDVPVNNHQLSWWYDGEPLKAV